MENEHLIRELAHDIREIRACLDGKDGVLVRLDRIEQLELARKKRTTTAYTLALSALVGVVVQFVKDFIKLT